MQLYRYRPINDWLEALIIRRECYFATSEQLNDPFECKFEFTVTENREEFLTRFSEGFAQLSEREQKLTALEFRSSGNRGEEAFLRLMQSPRALAEFIWEECYVKEAEKMQRYKHDYLLEQVRKNTGICCFSEVWDNTLMFAHYADSHRGCCVGFEVEDNSMYKVKYTDMFPTFREFPDDRWPVIEASILTKATQWSYEKEWRMITMNGPGPITLTNSHIDQVVFGCRTTEDDRNRVIQLVNRSPDHILLFQARPVDGSYDLEIAQLSIDT